jgi:hypothetical protein
MSQIILPSDANPLEAAFGGRVLEWIDIMNSTVLTANTAPNVTSRVVALVSASVFDAVNGIEPRFRPLLVRPNAPHRASQRAAAIQAAYAILLNLYPAQGATFLTPRRNASLAALAQTESANSIAAGAAWGQTVADAVWNARLTDGFTPPPPPFLGVQSIVGTPGAVGFWRPTPPANASGATPQIATMTPWVLTRPSQFRLPPPLALNSAEYAADLNEVRVMGTLSGSKRLPDQSELALFWALNTPLAWNRIAAQLSAGRGLTLTENAHLFALLNISLSDALIACWDSKYRYVFWRPVTAIRAGLTPMDADPLWEPWQKLVDDGFIYPCTCSRKDVLRALQSGGALSALQIEIETLASGVRDVRLLECAKAAQSALLRAQQWIAKASGGVVEAGARRFAMTLGRALALLLLCRQAQWSLDHEKDQRALHAAMRFAQNGVDLIAAEDVAASKALANDSES